MKFNILFLFERRCMVSKLACLGQEKNEWSISTCAFCFYHSIHTSTVYPCIEGPKALRL